MAKQVSDLPAVSSLTSSDIFYIRRASDHGDYQINGQAAVAHLQSMLLTNWTRVTASMTASAGDKILADSSGGAFTITLPASSSAGNVVLVRGVGGSVSTNNVTINPNGANIAGTAQDFIIDKDNYQVDLVYNNTTRGWEY